MSQRTGRQTAFLRFLFLVDKTQRKKNYRNSFRRTDEAFQGDNMGLIISGYYRSKLKRYKNLVQSLCDRRVSSIQINQLLQKTGEIMPLILRPYFKEDGGGISTRQKNNLRSDEGETE